MWVRERSFGRFHEVALDSLPVTVVGLDDEGADETDDGPPRPRPTAPAKGN